MHEETAMTKDELLGAILEFLKSHKGVESTSRIDDEDAIGIKLLNGGEYVMELQEI